MNLTKILIIVCVAAIGYAYLQHSALVNYRNRTATMSTNIKSLDAGVHTWKDKYNKEHSSVIQMQYTAAELAYSKDTLLKALKKTIAESKHKSNELAGAGIIISELRAELQSNSTNTVTIISNDSIKCQEIKDSTFIINKVCFDPRSIELKSVKTTINNEQDILFIPTKETVEVPRKFFLWRLFQRKHTVCRIEVINSNPYLNTKKSKFIKIVE